MATKDVPDHPSTDLLLHLGRWIPLVFLTTTVICGFMLGNYNHLSRMVSDLGAIGTPSRFYFSAGLLACSVMSALFIVGLCRVCAALRISRLPALLLLAYTISIAGAGVFPLPLRMHLLMGMPSVLLILSPLLSLALWRGRSRLPGIEGASMACLVVMALGFLAFLRGVLPDLVGLKQRFFHLGWCMWFLYLSYRFARVNSGLA